MQNHLPSDTQNNPGQYKRSRSGLIRAKRKRLCTSSSTSWAPFAATGSVWSAQMPHLGSPTSSLSAVLRLPSAWTPSTLSSGHRTLWLKSAATCGISSATTAKRPRQTPSKTPASLWAKTPRTSLRNSASSSLLSSATTNPYSEPTCSRSSSAPSSPIPVLPLSFSSKASFP